MPRRAPWVSGPGYTGDRQYWAHGRGYGHSHQWAQRYAYWPELVPYASWYLWDSWLPRYTLDEAYVPRPGQSVPEQALLVDTRNFPAELPALPTFAERGISLTQARIAKSADELGASERQAIEDTLDSINEQLAQLRRDRNYIKWLGPGYMIVPDLDTERFTWIKNATQGPSDLAKQAKPAKLSKMTKIPPLNSSKTSKTRK